jgi:hypothetical protein
VPFDNAPEVADYSTAGDYSTDNYNDDDIPSIMSEGFASAKPCDPIEEAHEICKDKMPAAGMEQLMNGTGTTDVLMQQLKVPRSNSTFIVC